MPGSSSGSRTPPPVASASCRISRGLARGLASSRSCLTTVNRAARSSGVGSPGRDAFTTSFQSPGSLKSETVPVNVSPRLAMRTGRGRPDGETANASTVTSVTAVPSAFVRPASNASGTPGEIRRCARRIQSASCSESSCLASQSTSCRQKRRCCSTAPCIAHRQVESPAKASTRPSPYSRPTSSGRPSAVTASGLAVGTSRPRLFAPSSGGSACQIARESCSLFPCRRIDTPPKRVSGSICSGPLR